MKNKFAKEWFSAFKRMLVAIFLLLPLAVSAEDGWVMVYQNPEGETVEIPMTEVGSLVAVDDAYDFSILSANGNILAEGVLKVSFEQKGSTGIRLAGSDNNQIARAVANKLTFIGISGEVFVYDTKGALQAKASATGGETIVNIGHLPHGVYVVKVGKQTFKFMKK